MASSGPFSRIKHFFSEVHAELLKCNWPTWAELRQSTLVVIISFILLGFFVTLSDVVLVWLVQTIL